MGRKLDPSFARIPAILLCVTNVIQMPFTLWVIAVGGSKLEMFTLFPLFFIHLPSLILLFASVISMLIVRKHRSAVIENLIPAILYVLQVATFWIFAFNT